MESSGSVRRRHRFDETINWGVVPFQIALPRLSKQVGLHRHETPLESYLQSIQLPRFQSARMLFVQSHPHLSLSNHLSSASPPAAFNHPRHDSRKRRVNTGVPCLKKGWVKDRCIEGHQSLSALESLRRLKMFESPIQFNAEMLIEGLCFHMFPHRVWIISFHPSFII